MFGQHKTETITASEIETYIRQQYRKYGVLECTKREDTNLFCASRMLASMCDDWNEVRDAVEEMCGIAIDNKAFLDAVACER